MHRIIIAVFENESAVFEGQSALKELHKQGDISLFASAVITKENGKVKLNQAADNGAKGTSLGILSGSLVGLLAGPAGMALGAYLGALGGLLYDLNDADFANSFLNDVANELEDGKSAVVADVDEGWTTPVNERLSDLGGTVYRKNRNEAEDELIKREAKASQAEIAELKEELHHSNESKKEAINKQIEKQKAKLEALKSHASKKMEQAKAEYKERIEILNQQIKEVNDPKKDKLTKKKAKLEADMEEAIDRYGDTVVKITQNFY